ncbi:MULTISPECIES: hypothetical protein [unclassified Bradyrhizobium]|uniref:hypothetical protein n=1 Tax=unclassified Bradyrhizobium TaxID=2631580 RepID=UPI0020B1CAE2|nr:MULTISPECIES: hypothetical protein [unclassified Bradyrhizobium]MCP3396920.1 hypothetical protein [Bradyrhizobium sp. CCGB20]MCP3405435.1 hypothetical protein [Bradyrhizobium sp. CCGB01]
MSFGTFTNPTNLYSQEQFPNIDLGVTFHVGPLRSHAPSEKPKLLELLVELPALARAGLLIVGFVGLLARSAMNAEVSAVTVLAEIAGRCWLLNWLTEASGDLA